MSIFYSENLSSRSVLSASGITDSLLSFDVSNSGIEKRLTLDELKKTGAQVVNVKQYGAVGNGIADDTAAIQSAINSISGVGGVIYFPVGDFLVSSTLNFHNGISVRGERWYTPGSVIKTSINDGTAVLKFDTKNSVIISDIFINSSAGTLTNCIGIHLDNICVWFDIERVRVRNCQIGMDVEGWISTMQHVYIDYCGTGFIGRQLNGSRIAVAVEQCYDHIQLIDCNSSTFWLTAEGNAGTMVSGISLNGCNYCCLDAPYMEFNTGCSGLVSALSIGESTACKDIVVSNGSVYTADGAPNSWAVVVDDCDGFRADNFRISTGASQGSRGLNVTSSAKSVDINGNTLFNFVNDASLSLRPIVNLFSNWDLSLYDDGFSRQVDTSCTVSKESLQATKYIRTSNEAIRVTATSGVALSRTILDLNAAVLNEVSGKTVTLGCWLYVPTATNYGDGTAAMFPTISLYDGISVTTMNSVYGKMVPGQWNFCYLKKEMSAASTGFRFYVQPVNGAGTSNGTEFLVLDSLFVAVGDVNPHWLMRAMPDNKPYRHNLGTVSGTADVRWKTAYDQYLLLGGNSTLTFTAPNKVGPLTLSVTQSGSGGYTLAFPTINWKTSGLQPDPSGTATSIYQFYYDGTRYHELSVNN